MERESVVAIVIISVIVLSAFYAIFVTSSTISNKVALIKITGEITSDETMDFLFETTSASRIVEEIKRASNDPSVKAVIFYIDSPGGSAVGSSEIARAIEELKKPSVTYVRETCASGAYWVASATNYIVAEPLSLVGNVGVLSIHIDLSGLLNKTGVAVDIYKRGKYKDMGIITRPYTAEEEKMINRTLDVVYERFIEEINKTRGSKLNISLDELAKGGIYLGEDAERYGIVDKTGDFNVAFEKAKELAGIKKAEIVQYRKESYIEKLLSMTSEKIGYSFAKGFFGGIYDMKLQLR